MCSPRVAPWRVQPGFGGCRDGWVTMPPAMTMVPCSTDEVWVGLMLGCFPATGADSTGIPSHAIRTVRHIEVDAARVEAAKERFYVFRQGCHLLRVPVFFDVTDRTGPAWTVRDGQQAPVAIAVVGKVSVEYILVDHRRRARFATHHHFFGMTQEAVVRVPVDMHRQVRAGDHLEG